MQNERTLKMKQDFMKLHNDGLSIKEIAVKFNLSPTTIYKSLDEIAKKEDCSREDLLKVVHSPHLTYDRQFEEVAEIDVVSYREKFERIKTYARELSNLMSQDISKIEEEADQYEEKSNIKDGENRN